MLSLRVWGSVLSSVVAAALVVTLVEPASALEGDVATNSSDVSISTDDVPSSVPNFTVPVPQLPSGDFSESFPALDDDPDDETSGEVNGVAPSFSVSDIASGVEESTEFGVGLALGSGFRSLATLTISNKMVQLGVQNFGTFSQSAHDVLKTAIGYRNAQWNP